MKLNKNGWGLKEMLIISGILLIFLLIATYYVYALYNRLDGATAGSYFNIERKLEQAAIEYVQDNNLSTSNEIVITSNVLINEGYIDNLDYHSNKSCKGYVKVHNYDYKTYIKCSDYSSENYDENMQ